jgi:hypothetical protein
LHELAAKLRADPVRRQEELDERTSWDVTLADGLDDEGARRDRLTVDRDSVFQSVVRCR